MKHTDLPRDLGADGLAMHARPRCVELIKTRISVTRSVQSEEIVYKDTNKFDSMHYVAQLSDRQHAAGMKLYALFVAAGLEPKATMRFEERVQGEVIPADRGDEVDADGRPKQTPRQRYRGLLKRLPEQMAGLLDAACHGRHPGVGRLATMQAGLDMLADWWGME